jgi:hypothetical protein
LPFTRFRKDQALKPLYTMIGSAAIVIARKFDTLLFGLVELPPVSPLGNRQGRLCERIVAFNDFLHTDTFRATESA